MKKKVHWEVHTNQEGKGALPAGSPPVRSQLQVNKLNYQTFGKKVDVAGAETIGGNQAGNHRRKQYSTHEPLKPKDPEPPKIGRLFCFCRARFLQSQFAHRAANAPLQRWCGAGGHIGEITAVGLIHQREIAHVSLGRPWSFTRSFQSQPRGLQHEFQILEHARALQLNRAGDQFTGFRISRNLPAKEDESISA